MKRFFLLCLLTLISLQLQAQAENQESAVHPAIVPLLEAGTVKAWVENQVIPEIEAGHATAAAVAVVLDGEVLFARNLGQFDPVKSVPIEQNHQFMIGSITKTLNGLAVAKLQQDGLIDSIDDPVNRYLERYQLPGEWGGQVTISQLLTHTAGLESPGFGSSAGDQDMIPATGEYIRDHMAEIVREPGIGAVYANLGPPIVGVMVEDLTGMRYDEHLHSEILEPLGIHDSRFEYDETGGPTLVHAGITSPDSPDEPVRYAPRTVNTPFIAPAGSIQATAADMARYMNALMAYAPEVVTPLMLQTTQQELFGNYPGLDTIGLGIMHGQWNELDTWGHGGLIAGFRSSMKVVPEKKLGVFLSFAGGTGTFESKGGDPGGAVDDLLVQALGPVVPKPAIDPVTELADVSGRYWMELRAYTTAETVMALRRVWTVTGSENGEILINGQRQDEIAPGLFQERRDDGRPPYLTALDGERFSVRYSYASRVNGMGDPSNVERLALLSFVVLLTGLASLFVRGRGRFAAPLAAIAASTLFYILFWAMLSGVNIDLELINGDDWRFRWAGILTWLTLIAGIVTFYGGFRGITDSEAGIGHRIGQAHRIILGVAALGYFYAMSLVNIV